MRVLLYMGTRPEIIKFYPVYKELKRRKHKIKVDVFYTGQHYSKKLAVFKDFKYRKVDLYKKIPKQKYDCVLVQGDTWSVLQGAVYALNENIPLAHVEAGIRSGDKSMIEEKVRILVDKYADFKFVPTMFAMANFKRSKNTIFVGNTVADLLVGHKKSTPQHILMTLHRPETVDNSDNLKNVLDAVKEISAIMKYKIKFFCHPRTRDKIEWSDKINVLDPTGYRNFIKQLKQSKLVITDSGGVQEEAAILKVPCITTRTSTERQETIIAGLNILTGYRKDKIVKSALEIVKKVEAGEFKSDELYGDGKTAQRIVEYLKKKL